MGTATGIRTLTCAALTAWMAPAAATEPPATDPLSDYRQMLADDNPAELAVARGQELWQTARGPKRAALTACDLGLGPGVVAGAAAHLPRYFADAGAVQDLETRLAWCMVSIQGIARAGLIAAPFSAPGDAQTDLEALTAYVAAQSRGTPVHIPQDAAPERAAFARGRALFYRRAGPLDFACASCHSADGRRIRLQELANLTRVEGGRGVFTHWPAYRLSQGVVRTMQWRLTECMRQEGLPDLLFASGAAVDLITYLGVMAEGGTMDAPSQRR